VGRSLRATSLKASIVATTELASVERSLVSYEAKSDGPTGTRPAVAAVLTR
jgi:hypothetical protein